MKVYTLTIHYGVNYGSALQTYALSRVLQEMNNEVKVINYIPTKYNLWNEFSKNKIGKYPALIVGIAFVLKAPKKIIRRKKFSSFLEKNVPLTQVYSSTKMLKENIPEADLYIVGSDQVWNFDYNENEDYSYFFDFVTDRSKCISYAASIGKDSLSDNQEQLMERFLKEFKGISVREDLCVDQLKKIGIDSKHVLDPTFLLTEEQWSELLKDDKVIREKYVLVYVMDFLHSDLLDIADLIKKTFGYKLYVVSFSKIKDSRIDRQYTYANPQMFLKLMKYASYVVTNSFHGIAFSINYSKQFIAVGKTNYNVRIQSLLRLFNLKDRFVPANTPIDEKIISQKIDYMPILEKMKQYRSESNSFLKSHLL